MAETATKPRTHKKYLRIPYAVRSIKITVDERERKLNGSELKFVSALFSFAEETHDMEITYENLAMRYGFSSVSAGRAARTLLEAKLIKRTKGIKHYDLTDTIREAIDKSAVKTKDGDREVLPFLMVEDWIYHAEFKSKYLTDKQAEILFYLVSRTNNGKEVFRASLNYIATGLNCSRTTVSKALDLFEKVGLITVRGKSVNKYTRMAIFLNDNLLRNKKREVLRPRTKGKPLAVKSADEKTERERYYAQQRQVAETRAEYMNTQALSDERYRAADGEYRAIMPKLEMAKEYGLTERDELLARFNRASLIRTERLAAMGMTEADLHPRYMCDKCEDTGFDKGGRPCDCYLKGRRRP